MCSHFKHDAQVCNKNINFQHDYCTITVHSVQTTGWIYYCKHLNNWKKIAKEKKVGASYSNITRQNTFLWSFTFISSDNHKNVNNRKILMNIKLDIIYYNAPYSHYSYSNAIHINFTSWWPGSLGWFSQLFAIASLLYCKYLICIGNDLEKMHVFHSVNIWRIDKKKWNLISVKH